MERQKPISHQDIKTAARISTIMLTATSSAYLDLHQVEAQAQLPCIVRVKQIREQFFQDKGGPAHPDGRPRFQPNIDQILGPAVGRRILVELGGDAFILVTNQQGLGIDQKSNRPDLTVTSPSNTTEAGKPAISVRIQQLNNGDSIASSIPCGMQKEFDILSEKGPLTVEAKQTVVPASIEVQRTPETVAKVEATATPQPTEVRPTQTPMPPTATPRVTTRGQEQGQNVLAWFGQSWQALLAAVVLGVALVYRRTRRIIINTSMLVIRIPWNIIDRRRGIPQPHPIWP